MAETATLLEDLPQAYKVSSAHTLFLRQVSQPLFTYSTASTALCSVHLPAIAQIRPQPCSSPRDSGDSNHESFTLVVGLAMLSIQLNARESCILASNSSRNYYMADVFCI